MLLTHFKFFITYLFFHLSFNQKVKLHEVRNFPVLFPVQWECLACRRHLLSMCQVNPSHSCQPSLTSTET